MNTLESDSLGSSPRQENGRLWLLRYRKELGGADLIELDTSYIDSWGPLRDLQIIGAQFQP